jgi:hypothetical protein
MNPGAGPGAHRSRAPVRIPHATGNEPGEEAVAVAHRQAAQFAAKCSASSPRTIPMEPAPRAAYTAPGTPPTGWTMPRDDNWKEIRNEHTADRVA